MTAYERLCRARRTPSESFSQVIRRARWEEPVHSGRLFLDAMRKLPPVGEDTLDALEEIQRSDRPPEDKWQSE